jgi:hypothetical protein
MKKIVVFVAALAALVLSSSTAVARSRTAHKPTALWVGDSYTMGAGSMQPRVYAEAHQVSRLFGWHMELDAMGGTGFVASSQYGPPIPDRLDADEALRPVPSYVVIDGGRNDHGTASAESLAVTSYFNAVAQAFPKARVVVIAPFVMRSRPADYSFTRQLLGAQAERHGWAFVDPLAEGWIGKRSAPLVAPDGVHPDSAGYTYIVDHLAPVMAKALWGSCGVHGAC